MFFLSLFPSLVKLDHHKGRLLCFCPAHALLFPPFVGRCLQLGSWSGGLCPHIPPSGFACTCASGLDWLSSSSFAWVASCSPAFGALQPSPVRAYWGVELVGVNEIVYARRDLRSDLSRLSLTNGISKTGGFVYARRYFENLLFHPRETTICLDAKFCAQAQCSGGRAF